MKIVDARNNHFREHFIRLNNKLFDVTAIL